MTDLPTSYQQYYVYTYREDGKVVYVGKGCGSRAWDCKHYRGDTKERHDWKQRQLANGLLPHEWVTIERRGLTEQEAFELEREFIQAHRPILNKLNNPDIDRRPEWAKYVSDLRIMGLSWKNIGRTFGVSPMTAWRNQ